MDNGKDSAGVTSITQAEKDNEIETEHKQSHAAMDHGGYTHDLFRGLETGWCLGIKISPDDAELIV